MEERMREEIERRLWTGQSLRQIARETGISRDRVRKVAETLGIEVLSFQARHCEVSEELRAFLDGLLLGGGCMVSRYPTTAYFTLASQYPKFLYWVSSELRNYGIEQKGEIHLMFCRGERREIWRYESWSYYELLPFRIRWYDRGESKRVPRDLIFSPPVAFLWYLRGGHLRRYGVAGGREHYRISFSLGRYPPEDRQFLVTCIINYGCSTAKISGTKIYIPHPESVDFLSSLPPCSPELEPIFGHKWLLGA